MTPSPYELIRAIQDQQRATDRLVQILAGMLDKSQPDPLLSFQPPEPVAVRPAPRKLRRVAGPAGRPPAEFVIDGVTISTTERRAKILQALQEQPRGLSDLVRLGFAPRTNAMMAQIVDINRDLVAAGSPFQIKAQPRPARSSGRGSIAPKYALVKFSETAAPEDPPAAQSEAAAGGSPPAGGVTVIHASAAIGMNMLQQRIAQETAGSAAQLPGNAAGTSPGLQPAEHDHVESSASAQPHCASGEPAIPSEAGDAGTGQASEAEIRNAVVPPGENAGSAVRDGALVSDLAPASAAAEARPPEVVPPHPPADDASPSKGERVLDMWANTNFTAKLIAEKVGCAPSSVSAFVCIARKNGDPRADARTPEALAARRGTPECRPGASTPAPALRASPIEPGDLIAVDVKLRRVSVGPQGGYETSSVQMARALDLLRGGQMFGLDAIARKAGWQSAEVARNALLLERNRLSQRGLDLYLDKFNARLREAA